MREGRIDAEHLSVCFRIHQTGVPVARFATDASADARFLFVQHHSERNMKRLEPQPCEIVAELLHPWLMADRRMWIGSAGRRFRGILGPPAVHLIEMLG